MNIWMVIDPEPGFEPIRIGDHFSGPVLWRQGGVPDEIAATNVMVDRTAIWGGIADLFYIVAKGVSVDFEALLGISKTEETSDQISISGCLELDRYMEQVHPVVVPQTSGVVQRFGALVEEMATGGDGVRFASVDSSVCRLGSYDGIEQGLWVRYHCVELTLAELALPANVNSP